MELIRVGYNPEKVRYKNKRLDNKREWKTTRPNKACDRKNVLLKNITKNRQTRDLTR